MKFNFLKSKKKRSVKRKKTPAKKSSRNKTSRSRSRNTPIRSGAMPKWGQKLIKLGFYAFAVAAVIIAHYYAFHSYYRGSNNLFVIRNVDENVVIDTGRAVTPDLVKMFLGITNGVHLFSMDVNKKRDQLLKNRPSIKDISIKRIVPDQMVVSVIERKPVARVGEEGEVVDEDGVVFARSAWNTFHLPLICQERSKHKTEPPMPGDRVQDMDMAAVMLAASLFRPNCRTKIVSIDTSKSRYLYLKFPDGREARFAWNGMGQCTPDSKEKMILQYDRLVSCMETDVGKIHHLWDAQHSDRIYGRPAGIVR